MNTIQLSRGSGYGGSPFHVGDTLRHKDEIVTVTEVSERYFEDDGLSFGVGDDSGYVYYAKARIATDEEAAPIRQREKIARIQINSRGRLEEIIHDIAIRGTKPAGPITLEGQCIINTQNLYGGGYWFVIEKDKIWYVVNNGADGDDWSRNNIRTGGAGAIGHYVSYTNELAEELYAIEAVLMKEAAEAHARQRDGTALSDATAKLLAQANLDERIFPPKDATICKEFVHAMWIKRPEDKDCVLGCSLDKSIVYIRVKSPDLRAYGGWVEDLRELGYPGWENGTRYYLSFPATHERLAQIEPLIPDWVGGDEIGRYICKDSVYTRTCTNAVDALNCAVCHIAALNEVSVAAGVTLVHADKYMAVWSDGAVSLFLPERGGRDLWRTKDLYYKNDFAPAPDVLIPSAIYPEEISMLIRAGFKSGGFDKEWLLLMRKVISKELAHEEDLDWIGVEVFKYSIEFADGHIKEIYYNEYCSAEMDGYDLFRTFNEAKKRAKEMATPIQF